MTYLAELTESQLLCSILASLRRLEASFESVPLVPPPLQIAELLPPPPDLSPVVAAITSLPAAPSADEIARALVSVLAPLALGRADSREIDRYEATAEALQKALEKIDFRLQGLTAGTGYIGGSVTLSPGATVGVTFPAGETGLAKDATLADVKRSVTDFETRLDYDVRLDGNPVYVAKNLQGIATSTASWVIQKLSYDATNRLTRAQVLTGSWDGRAALGWT